MYSCGAIILLVLIKRFQFVGQLRRYSPLQLLLLDIIFHFNFFYYVFQVNKGGALHHIQTHIAHPSLIRSLRVIYFRGPYGVIPEILDVLRAEHMGDLRIEKEVRIVAFLAV